MAFIVTCITYTSTIAPCKLGREVDVEQDFPRLIPVMTMAGLLMFITAIMALWPIWRYLTPVYMLVLFFGYSFSLMFLPSGHLGTLMFYVGSGAAAYISHTMPHDPVW